MSLPEPGVPPVSLPQPVRDAANAVFASYLLTSADAAAVVGQQAITLDLIGTLPEDQALARDHAASWSATTGPDLLDACTDIIGYAHEVAAFGDSIKAAAAEVEDGGSPDPFNDLLEGLNLAVNDRAGRLQTTGQALGVLGQALNDDGIRFATLASTVPAVYTPVLASLATQVSGLQATLAKDRATIVNAAVDLLPGMAAIGFAAAAAVVVGTNAGKVILEKGYTMTKGVVDSADAALTEQSATIEEYGALLTTQAQDRMELAVFSAVAGQVAHLTRSTAGAATSVTVLQSAWQSETSRLVLVGAMAASSRPSGLVAAVTDATTWWVDTGQQVTALVNQASLLTS